ncbi:hypothetical protein POL68_32740 [Stigmatella sp. ncwal1]|uniref:Uncharacterized protein n=1 Tax=Stigmatella ashevillensis TaxID=2995309 RepID=A0ABT5DHZ7_9BACT|nr:hypothetical protein [Stigmatella ashevillena]MDC0713276.1 hypothetical protein [Stigmatella ashevillena]
MTTRPEDFEFEALCHALESAVEHVPDTARDTISTVANALHYLYVTGQFTAFREYLRDTDRVAPSFVDSAHVFPDMARAEEWLQKQPLSSWGTLVKVAGKTFAVGKQAEMKLNLVPSFTPQEVDSPDPE